MNGRYHGIALNQRSTGDASITTFNALVTDQCTLFVLLFQNVNTLTSRWSWVQHFPEPFRLEIYVFRNLMAQIMGSGRFIIQI